MPHSTCVAPVPPLPVNVSKFEERPISISLRNKRQSRFCNVPPKLDSLVEPVPGLDVLPERLTPNRIKADNRPGKDKTVDLVKKRYSIRFSQAPDVGKFGYSAPALPTLPLHFSSHVHDQNDTPIAGQFGRGPGHPSPNIRTLKTTRKHSSIEIDAQVLADPNLCPKEYVNSLLAEATEHEISQFRQELVNLNKSNFNESRKNLIGNWSIFLKSSRLGEETEASMKLLKEVLSELTEIIPKTMTVVQETSTVASHGPKPPRPSSIANLETLWSSHMRALWKRIENSQRFLPDAPGRHIVYESGKWWEMNPVSWKIMKRIHIVLLNDHILIAIRKELNETNSKSGPASETRQYSVKYCWPLVDIQLKEAVSQPRLADRDGHSDSAIFIRVGSQSFAFAISRSNQADRASFLSNYREAVEALRKSQERQRNEQGQQRAGDISGSPPPAHPSSPSPKCSSSAEISNERELLDRIQNMLDDLEIALNTHHYERAVSKLHRTRETLAEVAGDRHSKDALEARLDRITEILVQNLLKEMIRTHAWPKATVRNAGLLRALDRESQARGSYLHHREGFIRDRTRDCVSHASLVIYVHEISYILFTLTRNTVYIYRLAFRDPGPSLAAWVTRRVMQFNDFLKNAMRDVEICPKDWQKCLYAARCNSEILGEVGMNDYTGVVGLWDRSQPRHPAGLQQGASCNEQTLLHQVPNARSNDSDVPLHLDQRAHVRNEPAEGPRTHS